LLLGTDLSESDKNSGRYKLMPTSFDRGHFRDVIDLNGDSIRAKKAAARANPLENDPDAIAAGKLLFIDHCAECHGDDAKGGRKGPSLRVSDVRNATPGTLFWLLTNGVVRKKMPSWSKLPEPQRWQLVRFLKAAEGAEH
jgi:cytochrome c oxidase cbb3-type subunit 3